MSNTKHLDIVKFHVYAASNLGKLDPCTLT